MPICRMCSTQLPTCELRNAPLGWRCKDKYACLDRQATRIEQVQKEAEKK